MKYGEPPTSHSAQPSAPAARGTTPTEPPRATSSPPPSVTYPSRTTTPGIVVPGPPQSPSSTSPIAAPETSADPGQPSSSTTPRRTYPQTTGGPANTWSDPRSAGGTPGRSILAFDTVGIGCRIEGFEVEDGNTRWYRIADSPWNGSYYVSADAFYNNGQTTGSLVGTPFYDPVVPNAEPRQIEPDPASISLDGSSLTHRADRMSCRSMLRQSSPIGIKGRAIHRPPEGAKRHRSARMRSEPRSSQDAPHEPLSLSPSNRSSGRHHPVVRRESRKLGR